MQRGVPTERGGEWRAVSVARLLRRIEIIPGIEIGTGFSRVLPPRSVNAVMASPPYAEQRSRQYGGISEIAYPAWTVEWMDKLRPALVEGGNVAIVIRAHFKEGKLGQYVLKTRLGNS